LTPGSWLPAGTKVAGKNGFSVHVKTGTLHWHPMSHVKIDEFGGTLRARRPVASVWRSLLLLGVLAFSGLAANLRADISLDVQASRNKIYQGETFLLYVTVNGVDENIQPDASALSADVRLLGSQSKSHYSVININGNVSRESVTARLFAFEVQPRAAGVVATGPIRYTHGGQTYSGRGPDVQVTGVEKQDTLIARIAASSENVLVDDTFTITLVVDIAGLPSPYEKNEPILQNTPLHIDCEFFNQAEIAGLRAPDPKQILQGIVDQNQRGPGFTINDYKPQASPFDLFGEVPRLIRFRPEHKLVTRNDRTFHEYAIAFTYTPQQEGDYTFGSAAIKGPVILGGNAQGLPVTKDFFSIAPAVTVRVVPPPETNRPDWFIGSVGTNLNAHAEFDTALCKVGDPLTLTLNVTGSISLGNLRPPLLNLQPELTADFRIYDDNVETTAIPGGKRFRYRIRPIREGTLEFPSIKLAWFDTKKRNYQTIRTAPIPLQARPNTQIVSDDSTTNHLSQTMHLAVEKATAIPAAITVVTTGAQPDSLGPSAGLLWLLILAGPLVFGLVCAGQYVWQHREQLMILRRRSRALAQAQRALRAGMSPDDATTARVMRAFLAERLNVAGGALTGGEAEQLLRSHGVPPEIAGDFGDLLTRLDHALYAPESAAGKSDEPNASRALYLMPRITIALAQSVKKKHTEDPE
jgi:hypothetical protein